MKFMVKTAVAAVASILLLNSCSKKQDPLAEGLALSIDMEVNFGKYRQEYKKNDSLYDIVNSSSMFLVRQRGSFLEESQMYGSDSSVADTSAGEYNRATLIGSDTLVQLFRSPIAGNMTSSEIRCEIEKIDSLSNADTAFYTHTLSGKTELQALYEDQIIKEYKAVAKDMMWEEVYKKVEGIYSKEEAQKRYSLVMKNQLKKTAIPQSQITVTDSTIQVYYEEPFSFLISFAGRVDKNE